MYVVIGLQGGDLLLHLLLPAFPHHLLLLHHVDLQDVRGRLEDIGQIIIERATTS